MHTRSICVCLDVCMCVAADPSEVWPLPNDSIMGLSPSSPLVAWYGVGLGRVAVSLCTHTRIHTHTHIQILGPEVWVFHGFVPYFVTNRTSSCKGPLLSSKNCRPTMQPEIFFLSKVSTETAMKGVLFLSSES